MDDAISPTPTRYFALAPAKGILDMDRQYNAVNFQYFAQAAEAGVTRAGAEASFKRRLCTSRLSFYIEAGQRLRSNSRSEIYGWWGVM